MLVDPFIPETVLSTIPLALTKALHREHEGPPELVQVKITWRGGGKSIFLARAGDDDWKGRQQMTQESPGSTTYHASVSLPPGTHHIRFLIDDTWRVADDLPTAVDDQGSLANYVAVPINYSPPPVSNVPASPPTARPRPQGQSFWSAASSTSDDDPPPTHSQPSTAATTTGKPPPQAVWTSVLPQELIEAAHEEEMYLAASEGQPHSHHSGAQIHRVAGFVPAPNIPPAPGLPRHLDKLILNARVVVGGAGGAVVGTGVRKVGTGGTGTGPTEGGANGGVSNSVAGRSKGRERERDRERRDGQDPPLLSSPMMSSAFPSSPLVPSSTPTRPLTLNIDSEAGTPALTDDASVLPVPSHVVLHHLSTSAIRNGVLAVGNTTRYRKKYLTTIYYKPT
ncbi:hypothetical protein C0991_007696 [Blastosporella zonata]|nr:hypothetical protein C0991_007696 [Blastosporella zonata]